MSWVIHINHVGLARQVPTLMYLLGNLVCYHRLTCHLQQAHYERVELTD